MDDEKVFQHESYGMIGYSRTSHGPHPTRLFGSAVDQHMSTIHIRIHTSERRHKYSQDWFSARQQIIDVELSAVQFAEFLTTGNMGEGVPCTIRYANGKRMEDPPAELVEAAEVREGFTAQCKALGAKLAQRSKAIDAILAGTKFGKSERDEIRKSIAMIVQDVSADLPFVMEQFHEATDKILAAAKAEADAFLTHAITRAGLKALRGENGRVLLGEVSDESQD